MPTKVCTVKAMIFPSSHVWAWELGHKEDWTLKNWRFQIGVLEKILESPLDSKKTKPVNPKGIHPEYPIGRTDAKAEAPTLWLLDVKSWLTGKDPDAGKDWGQEEKGVTEHEMVGWHHWLNGHEFEQAPGDGEGQGSLACYSPRGHKESDTTWQLNSNKHKMAAGSWNCSRLTCNLPNSGFLPFEGNRAVKVKVDQSCLTLCDPTDYTVHGILQARILE